jgi:hypothetical protein
MVPNKLDNKEKCLVFFIFVEKNQNFVYSYTFYSIDKIM